jgi:hypothetical protein
VRNNRAYYATPLYPQKLALKFADQRRMLNACGLKAIAFAFVLAIYDETFARWHK